MIVSSSGRRGFLGGGPLYGGPGILCKGRRLSCWRIGKAGRLFTGRLEITFLNKSSLTSDFLSWPNENSF